MHRPRTREANGATRTKPMRAGGGGAHPNKNNPLGHSRQVEVVDNILGNIAVEWEALAVLRGCGGRCTRARCQENTRNAAHAVVRELGGIRPDGGRAIARAQGI